MYGMSVWKNDILYSVDLIPHALFTKMCISCMAYICHIALYIILDMYYILYLVNLIPHYKI